jgi:outer membrane protein assembly factor BamB
LNAADGSTAWSFDNSPNGDIGMISADAWADYSGKLYFTSRARAGGSSQTVWCLDYTASSATKCSSFNPSTSIGDIDSSPVLYQGVLYVGNNAGTVYALDPTSGSTLGSYATGDGAVKGFITPAFTALPRKLYLATTNKIWCLSHNDNGNTGTSITEIWDTGATIAGPSIPILRVGTNDLYAGSTDGKLYQVDVTAPGSPTPLSLGSATVGSPAIDVVNGLLHVGTEAGVVYAITLPLS